MPAKKKDASVRRRTNRASTASVLGKAAGDAPALPVRYDDDGDEMPWRRETLDWWADLWAAPMSSEYHSSDRHALFLLAVLMDQFWAAPDQKLASEIRLQRQAFGLTPYDRRRLEWTIETAEDAKDAGARRRGRAPEPTPAPAPADDPRLKLVQ